MLISYTRFSELYAVYIILKTDFITFLSEYSNKFMLNSEFFKGRVGVWTWDISISVQGGHN